MKILELVFSLSPGGAERFAVDLSNELSETNDVVLMTILDDTIDSERRNFYKFDLSQRVQYKCLSQPNGYSLKKIWTIYKEIKDQKPDVLHLHGQPMVYFCIFAILFLCRKMKIVQTIHSDLTNGYTKGIYKFIIGCMGRFNLYSIVALSEENYKQVRSYYPKSKAACIVNGRAPMLPSEAYSFVENEMNSFRRNSESLLFLHVARFSRVKNQKLLIRSFNKFIDNGGDAELVIVGIDYDTPEGLTLQSESCSRIHYIGSRKNIPDYMLCSDVFCLSSDFEGMPITLLEASLAGLPCVCTPVGGVSSIIDTGVNGVITKDHTEKSYVSALEFIASNFDKLKVNAMEKKENSVYTINECAKKYVSFFKS